MPIPCPPSSLVAPSNNSIINTTSPTLSWANGDCENWYYGIQVSTDSSFDSAANYWAGNTANGPDSSIIISNLSYNMTYYWRVCGATITQPSFWSSPWCFTTKQTAVIPQKEILYSKHFIISSNGISYCLPTSSNVCITLFDIAGRRIKSFNIISQPAGSHFLIFNSMRISAGTYILLFKAGNFINQGRVHIIE